MKENGITEALKPAAKFDVSGLGHKGFNDFQWWDHAFNRAAKAFDVKVADDKVVVEKKEVDGSTGRIKTKKDVIVESGNLAYGTFCKTGTLSNGVIENVKEHTTVKEEKDYSLKLSDEELFRMCDGLTAHKYSFTLYLMVSLLTSVYCLFVQRCSAWFDSCGEAGQNSKARSYDVGQPIRGNSR